ADATTRWPFGIYGTGGPPVAGTVRFSRGPSRVRPVGAALRSDGTDRLPPGAAPPAGRGGCLPGHVHGAGRQAASRGSWPDTGRLAVHHRLPRCPRRT